MWGQCHSSDWPLKWKTMHSTDSILCRLCIVCVDSSIKIRVFDPIAFVSDLVARSSRRCHRLGKSRKKCRIALNAFISYVSRRRHFVKHDLGLLLTFSRMRWKKAEDASQWSELSLRCYCCWTVVQKHLVGFYDCWLQFNVSWGWQHVYGRNLGDSSRSSHLITMSQPRKKYSSIKFTVKSSKNKTA